MIMHTSTAPLFVALSPRFQQQIDIHNFRFSRLKPPSPESLANLR